MRVSFLSYPEHLSQNLGRLSVEQLRLQMQATSGQRVASPDDDPSAVRRFLDLQSEFQIAAQYISTTEKLDGLVQSGFRVMTELKKIVDRAGELSKSLDTLSASPENLKSIRTEVNQLLEQAISLGNTREGGVYLFGGTKNTQPPFQSTRAADGLAMSCDYIGSSDVPKYDIAPGVTMNLLPPGGNDGTRVIPGLFKDATSGVDLIGHLIQFREALKAGDLSLIQSQIAPALDRDADQVITTTVAIGASQTQLTVTGRQLSARTVVLTGAMSKEVDVDLAETLVSLNETQAAYTAALQAGAKVMKQSLMDYV